MRTRRPADAFLHDLVADPSHAVIANFGKSHKQAHQPHRVSQSTTWIQRTQKNPHEAGSCQTKPVA